MEEIDIIELLQRVKEGKAPKRIEVYSKEFRLHPSYIATNEKILFELNSLYITSDENKDLCDYDFWKLTGVCLKTKIKILDKPIIEELKIIDDGYTSRVPDNFEIMAKINEIIKWINKENKDE